MEPKSIDSSNWSTEAFLEKMARPAGFEPATFGWKPKMIPFHHGSVYVFICYLVDQRGYDPRPPACKAGVLPLSLQAHLFLLSLEGAIRLRKILRILLFPNPLPGSGALDG